MATAIHLRNVPDAVHDALAQAARDRGLSLTTYLQHELARLARQPELVQHNAQVIRKTQKRIRGEVGGHTIREALEDGRRQK